MGEASRAPEVDLVIAVHDAGRPVERAVASVFATGQERVRVTVVCHNLERDVIAAKLEPLVLPSTQLRLLELQDGIRSPAGPFNLGIERAEAPYVAVMGSDDRLEPGAVESWLAAARRTNAEAVITRLVHAAGPVVPTPVARPSRIQGLDGVRDRLSYRSAPLGLVARTVITRLDLRMKEGLPTGEDVAFTTRLWFEGERIAFDRRGPAYVIGDDAVDRVTFAPRSIEHELAFVHDLVGAEWFRGMALGARRAVVVKLVRIHLFGAVYNRQDPGFWTEAERALLQGAADVLALAGPGYEAVLSIEDRRLLDQIRSGTGSAEELVLRSRRRRAHGRPLTLLTRNPAMLLAREAPLRFMTASVLARR